MAERNKASRAWLVLLAWTVAFSCFCAESEAFAFGGCANVGDLMVEVLANCGEPSSVRVRDQEMIGTGFVPYHVPDGWMRGPVIITTVEDWIYNFGPTRFIYILRFENGILRSINTGGYGY